PQFLFFLLSLHPPISTLFPYTTLFRSPRVKAILDSSMERWKARWGREPYPGIHEYAWDTPQQLAAAVLSGYRAIEPGVPARETQDRKSTRLNSSHVSISYAVFCLKKKK